MRGIAQLLAAVCAALALAPHARAADTPLKAPQPAFYDWTGFYFGAHAGYGWGRGNWSAQNTLVSDPALSGSLDFASRAGGLLGGFQAGYNYMLPSHVVLGFETDLTFPNYLSGSQNFTSPAIGQASFSEAVEFSGTARGRVGYAFDRWMAYGTGGFAFAYDQLRRTQLAGTPLAGTAVPGTVEAQMLGRIGWTAGAGVEYAFAPKWTAKAEYLFGDYAGHSNLFAQGGQRFDSNLSLQQVHLGVNYRPFDDAKQAAAFAAPDLASNNWGIHAQTTYTQQYAPPFHSPYLGPNSLISNQSRETWDATLFAGVRLWDGAELWFNPEIDQGFGLSSTVGVAGFPSGEAFKLGQDYPYFRLHRAFVRQTINLGGEKEKVEADLNQLPGEQTANRLVVTVGKFAAPDIFDSNRYAHDPKNDFLNWGLIEAASYDYAADAWGFSYGAAAEWYQDFWAIRAGLFDLSLTPNSEQLDPSFSQFQYDVELEERHQLWGQPGKLKLTGFLSRGRMGHFNDAINLALDTGNPADIAAVRRYSSRGGLSLNLEQQLTTEVGLFARAGFARGDVEPFDFTDVDQTVSGGLSIAGKQWGRPNDTWGVAGVVNNITQIHQQFLNLGGTGILVGDGQLPHPGLEQIVETYYSIPIDSWKLTFDYQYIVNPAYNRDRGPVSVFGTRLHWQF